MGDIIRGTSSLSGLYRGDTEIQKVYRGTQEIWTAGPTPVFTYPGAGLQYKQYATSYPQYMNPSTDVSVDQSWNCYASGNNTSDLYFTLLGNQFMRTGSATQVTFEVNYQFRIRAVSSYKSQFFIDFMRTNVDQGSNGFSGFGGWPSQPQGQRPSQKTRLISWSGDNIKAVDENGDLQTVAYYNSANWDAYRTVSGKTFITMDTYGMDFQFGYSTRLRDASGVYTGCDVQFQYMQITPISIT